MGHEGHVVVVTGATGRQGGAAARHLLSNGWRVRALTRNPKSKAAQRLQRAGVDVVRADMGNPATLLPAFQDAYGVFSVQNPLTSGLEAEITQGRNVADAAWETGIKHVVYGSAGVGVRGTGIGSWESKLEIESHMAALGLPVTVLRPMAFMELMTDKRFYPAVSTWHLMPKLMGDDRPVAWLSVDDLGAVVARAFADPDRFVGAEFRLAADLRSNIECREIWREVTRRDPRRFPMPMWTFERIVGTDLTTMWRWLRTGELNVDVADTRAILPTASTVKEWLVRYHSRARS